MVDLRSAVSFGARARGIDFGDASGTLGAQLREMGRWNTQIRISSREVPVQRRVPHQIDTNESPRVPPRVPRDSYASNGLRCAGEPGLDRNTAKFYEILSIRAPGTKYTRWPALKLSE